MSEHLKKITTRAKAIRRAHPSKKWTDCIKLASKELHTGAARKPRKTHRKAAQIKKPATRPRRTLSAPGTRTGENIAHNILRIVITRFKAHLNGLYTLRLGDTDIFLNTSEMHILRAHIKK